MGGDAMVTILTDSGEKTVPEAEATPDALWLSARAAEEATGWEVKPEGLCKGEMCVPLPAGREQEYVRGARVNLAALWRRLDQAVARSDRGDVWAVGESAQRRAAALRSLEAPDFTLPDAAGRLHSLSDYRGRKVLLVTWASW